MGIQISDDLMILAEHSLQAGHFQLQMMRTQPELRLFIGRRPQRPDSALTTGMRQAAMAIAIRLNQQLLRFSQMRTAI